MTSTLPSPAGEARGRRDMCGPGEEGLHLARCINWSSSQQQQPLRSSFVLQDHMMHDFSTYKAALVVMLWTCIWEVLSSNLFRDTDNPKILLVLLSPSRLMPREHISYVTTTSFQIFPNSSPYHSALCGLYTKSAVNIAYKHDFCHVRFCYWKLIDSLVI